MLDSSLDALRDLKGRLLRRWHLRRLRAAKHRITNWLGNVRRWALRRSEGERLLLERFARAYGRPLDLANPQTFTEKLFCRMVRWNRHMDPEFSRLADKLAVRGYVSSKVGDEHLVKILWQGSGPAQIPFDRLPANYVIKPNHGSGDVVAVTGASDRDDLIRSAKKWLGTNYYWQCREYQYYRIPPRLMIEEFLANADGSEAPVYRFWCFDGVPHLVSVGNMSRSMNPYYDMAWNLLELQPLPKNLPQPRLERPEHLEQMIAVASRLSEDFDFVRVDLYDVSERILFSELTFTPRAGYLDFKPAEWDLKLGRLWTMREHEPEEGRSSRRPADRSRERAPKLPTKGRQV